MKPVDQLVRPCMYGLSACKTIEQALAHKLPPHQLMGDAGHSIAKLAMAVAPHAQEIWVACGPGNNGGDGMAAALQLHQKGKRVYVTRTGGSQPLTPDAQWALEALNSAQIPVHAFDSSSPVAQADLIIDALLGCGTDRPVIGELAAVVAAIRRRAQSGATVLAVDVPTGLMADTGHANESGAVKASYTLSLIALRAGLFTAMGRELCGKVWLEPLGADAVIPELPDVQPLAILGLSAAQKGAPLVYSRRSEASHKGQFGDVAVVGGESATQGAAVLAAHAALKAGAGRVYLSLLNDIGTGKEPVLSPAMHQTVLPDIMVIPWTQIDLAGCTVVAGCGAGHSISGVLPNLISNSPSLVLDADALNFLASGGNWDEQLKRRNKKGWATVLTPHPKEAARLLGVTVVAVQQDRLTAAKELAVRFQATVVLKGSGTIIASPTGCPLINQTGNGKLAIAGTGDVLAGMIATALAQIVNPQRAAEVACYWHGLMANRWPNNQSLTASELVQKLPGV
jgi:hydroxyethylthiazole kinase-like uncharacterized protein yjeF